MFVNGEVTSTTVNQSLPEVVAKAAEALSRQPVQEHDHRHLLLGRLQLGSPDVRSVQRSSVSTSKTDAQKADTKAAILNADFRRAVYAAYSAHAVEAITLGEEHADGVIRNTLIPYTFQTTSDGRAYGSIVEKYAAELVADYEGIDLNDGHDAWYNPRARQDLCRARQRKSWATASPSGPSTSTFLSTPLLRTRRTCSSR